MNLVDVVEKQYIRDDLEEFKVGDQIRVFVKVTEGKRERLQAFEGVVIKIKGSGTRKTFTVRRVTGGYGVERVFPFSSPAINKIEVVKRGAVRRAKLYYIRGKSKKQARIKEAKRVVDAK
jgi:large subunit ribosomal protein L19